MKFKGALLTLAVSAVVVAAPSSCSVTYYKDVAPIVQNRCQECHRPGEVAPMSFMTYDEARPWAKAIRQAVITKKMPPWFADPHFGKLSNDRSLSQSAMDTLVAWADSGAKAGDKKDAPAPREFFQGWQIGKPDMVIRMPEAVEIPATGVVEYTYVVL